MSVSLKLSNYSRSSPESSQNPTLESLNINKSGLEDLSDRKLVDNVEKLRTANKRTEIECDIWYNFINKMDPKLLKGMDRMLHYANIMASTTLPKLSSQISIIPTDLPRAESVSSIQSGFSTSSYRKSSAMGSWLSSSVSGICINLQTKVELAKREKEQNESQMASFQSRSKAKRNALSALLQELEMELTEIKEARDIFESTIVRDGTDPITGKIPVEKFTRYIEEWLKSADSIIEKLRLRTCTLQYRNISLKKQLAQKEVLGESLNPVDFDVIKIENKVLAGQLKTKNCDLVKLKYKTGCVNLLLAKKRRYLQKQLKIKSDIENKIEEHVRKRKDVQNECIFVETEFKKSNEKLEDIKQLINNYTVPELMEYIRLQKDLDDLKKDLKVWSRRNHLQKIALSSCIKTMKRLTGRRAQRESWYNPDAKPQIQYEDDESLG